MKKAVKVGLGIASILAAGVVYEACIPPYYRSINVDGNTKGAYISQRVQVDRNPWREISDANREGRTPMLKIRPGQIKPTDDQDGTLLNSRKYQTLDKQLSTASAEELKRLSKDPKVQAMLVNRPIAQGVMRDGVPAFYDATQSMWFAAYMRQDNSSADQIAAAKKE